MKIQVWFLFVLCLVTERTSLGNIGQLQAHILQHCLQSPEVTGAPLLPAAPDPQPRAHILHCLQGDPQPRAHILHCLQGDPHSQQLLTPGSHCIWLQEAFLCCQPMMNPVNNRNFIVPPSIAFTNSCYFTLFCLRQGLTV